MIKLKLTTKTAKELEQEIQLKNKHKNNQGYQGLCSIKIYTIISFKDELKELIKKHIPLPRLHDDLWDDINKLIKEIESVEAHKKT